MIQLCVRAFQMATNVPCTSIRLVRSLHPRHDPVRTLYEDDAQAGTWQYHGRGELELIWRGFLRAGAQRPRWCLAAPGAPAFVCRPAGWRQISTTTVLVPLLEQYPGDLRPTHFDPTDFGPGDGEETHEPSDGCETPEPLNRRERLRVRSRSRS